MEDVLHDMEMHYLVRRMMLLSMMAEVMDGEAALVSRQYIVFLLERWTMCLPWWIAILLQTIVCYYHSMVFSHVAWNIYCGHAHFDSKRSPMTMMLCLQLLA